jgi:glycine/D-amino acid oxidase-like deaminating enzyme
MQQAIGEVGFGTPWGSIGHDHDLYVLLADSAAHAEEMAELRQYAAAAEELAQADDHALYRALADRAWGVAHRLAGEGRLAQTRLTHALAGFEALGARWQVGRTRVQLAEVALAEGQPDPARDHLGQALEAFEALGAAPDAARARARLDSLE